jgi:hypothetical protein
MTPCISKHEIGKYRKSGRKKRERKCDRVEGRECGRDIRRDERAAMFIECMCDLLTDPVLM